MYSNLRDTPTALRRSFFEEVYEVVKLVPYGQVTTYGAIACYLGTAGSARMVGWALHQAIHQKEIPAHRVLNRNGLLTGKRHFGGQHTMEELLTSEGIVVHNDRVQNFESVFWDPRQADQVLA